MPITTETITLVVPFWESDPEKKHLLKRLIDSVEGYDELIVVWNQGMGFTRAVNKGYELAKGDYIVMACDDIYFLPGKNNLRELVDERGVVCPHINGKPMQKFWGTCWATPRWVYEEIGMIPEEYADGINFEDDEVFMSLRSNGIPVFVSQNVLIEHPEGGRTIKMMPEKQAKIDRNRAVFRSRWGVDHADV